MITCGLLAGCGGQSQQERFESIRQPIDEAETISLTATVTANFTDKVEEFTLSCECRDGDWTLQVTQPEIIAGVTARISEGDSTLEYEDAILSTGDLTDSGITPIQVVPMVVEALADGYIDSLWTEEDCLTAKLIYDDTVAVTIWFDEANGPKAAELSENGTVKAACTIENFTTEGSIQNESTEETDLGGDQSPSSGT